MKNHSEHTSKLISYWLRHNPADAGIVIDDYGWTAIDHIIVALNSRNLSTDLEKLLQLNNSFDKIRWEIDVNGGRIRATHGHSISVLIEDKIKVPPDVLFHGTAIKYVDKIAAQGLLPMSRQFVHLSETVETAFNVGKRHGKPIIIEIETETLIKGGWTFFQTSDNVWLTSAIPVSHLLFQPWHPMTTIDTRGVSELKREIGNRTSHFLFPKLDDLIVIWKSSASDDTLFQDRKTGECFMVHLTYTRQEQEIDGWPYIEKYLTIEKWFENRLSHDQRHFYDLE